MGRLPIRENCRSFIRLPPLSRSGMKETEIFGSIFTFSLPLNRIVLNVRALRCAVTGAQPSIGVLY
jgi:hypothetical protein